MSKKINNISFVVFAIFSLLAGLYHTRGLFYPNGITPAWRHVLFILINTVCVYGFLKRPKWFIGFLGLLTLQQWYSHGGYAIGLWIKTHTIHWISVGVIVLLPLEFLLLLADSRKRQ